MLSPRKHDVNSRIGTTWPLASHEQQEESVEEGEGVMKKNDVRVSSFQGDVSKHINTLPTPYMHYSFNNRSSLPPRLRAYKDID